MARQIIAKRTITPAVGDFGTTQAFIGLLSIFGYIGLGVAVLAAILAISSLDKGSEQGGPEMLSAACSIFAVALSSALGCFIGAELFRLAMRAIIALERIAPIGGKNSSTVSSSPAPSSPLTPQQSKPLPPLP